ncbi:MAG TPA: hypothetical protein VHX65_20190 [Pirellulales bacterium]|nr:hypothetical protein [Pirellulales bacterium]
MAGLNPTAVLDREEYVEQAHLFRALGERMRQNMSVQELLVSVKEEILSTTRLPLALDYLAAELRLRGMFSTAMAKLSHYFTPFQTYVVAEAEADRGKFDLSVALTILEREAQYRAAGATPQGIFIYEFECLCRNRLGYDHGLAAVAGDPLFDDAWREWIGTVRRQVGIVDFADLIYVRSRRYIQDRERQGLPLENAGKSALFGEREGRIAWANRRKDPLLLFAALHRQLGYPAVPRLEPIERTSEIIPALMRRIERLETRIKLLEEEQKGGIDLTKFFGGENARGTPRDG